MKLYSQDLGERLNGEIQKQRLLNSQSQPKTTTSNFFLGWILGGVALSGLFWAMQAFAVAVMGSIISLGLLGLYAYSTLRVSDTSEYQHGVLTSYELQSACHSATDTLTQQFLTLANAVVALSVTEDATAEREVRNAISALGLAVEALPPEQKVITDNPLALRAEAEAQNAGAQIETDVVIAASLRRRSDSLSHRADTAARTLLLLTP